MKFIKKHKLPILAFFIISLIFIYVLYIYNNRLNIKTLVRDSKVQYYSSEAECRQKTVSGCECMLTNINTSICTGWAPY